MGFYKSNPKLNDKIKHSCSICDNDLCNRHNPKNFFPWKYIIISEKLNTAAEKFYNRILLDFISSWYTLVSSDDTLIKELQYCIKYTTAEIVDKVIQLDLPKLISSKLLPCAIKHLDDYMYIEQIAKQRNLRINNVAVEYLGNRLHGAVTSRNNELTYLREVTAALLPRIIPHNYRKSKCYNLLLQEIISGWILLPLMDVLADPNIINSLIIIAYNYDYKNKDYQKDFKEVELLKNFDEPNPKHSLFYKNLNHIKENTELLYTFMQFLKSENMVHLLQFCLDVDDFNKKLSEQEITKSTLEDLYAEAEHIYKEYLSKSSKNYIDCKEKLANDFKIILKDGIYCIAKIKISGPLIEAYKIVFNNLENKWLPLFFQSNEFYTYLCGPKVSSNYNKVNHLTRYKKNESPSQTNPFKLTSSVGKIKSVLKNNQPIEGAIYPIEVLSTECDTEYIFPNGSEIFRDISSWQISIASYLTIHGLIYYHITVKQVHIKNDNKDNVKVILRKDQDFYTLKAKLVEFHGEQEISNFLLPTRKATTDISSRMRSYESFLKQLLANPTLRGSDLVYLFLTTDEDFSMFISTYGSTSQELGNIYMSVTQRLKREKGQNLDNFMNNFLLSTQEDKNVNLDVTEIGNEIDTSIKFEEKIVPPPKTYRNCVFNDNFGISYGKLKTISTSAVNPINVLECFFYLGKHILNLPYQLLQVYVSICNFALEGVETMWNKFLRKNLNTALAQENLEVLISFLEEIIFSEEEFEKTDMENQKKVALNILKDVNIPYLHKIYGKAVSEGIIRIWEILQHSHFNKQLIYHLFDIILNELYPEIVKIKE